MTSIHIDDDTADRLRDAVKNKHGKHSWGKIKEEVKIAIDNHIKLLEVK